MARASPGVGPASELGRALAHASNTPLSRVPVARPSSAYDDAVSHVMLFVGIIMVAVFASTSASASDVPGMTCAGIGSFARQVAEHKAEGVSTDDAVRHLRGSFGSKHLDTEHELEKIVRAIYGMHIFSTASPDEVGTAYQTACEMD